MPGPRRGCAIWDLKKWHAQEWRCQEGRRRPFSILEWWLAYLKAPVFGLQVVVLLLPPIFTLFQFMLLKSSSGMPEGLPTSRSLSLDCKSSSCFCPQFILSSWSLVLKRFRNSFVDSCTPLCSTKEHKGAKEQCDTVNLKVQNTAWVIPGRAMCKLNCIAVDFTDSLQASSSTKGSAPCACCESVVLRERV